MNTDETLKAAADRAEMNQIVGNGAASRVYDAFANSETGRALEEMGKLLDEWRGRHPIQNPSTLEQKADIERKAQEGL